MTHEEWINDLKERYSGVDGICRTYHWEYISTPEKLQMYVLDGYYTWFVMELMIRS